MAAEHGDGLDIGLDARSTARIGPGDNQDARSLAVMPLPLGANR